MILKKTSLSLIVLFINLSVILAQPTLMDTLFRNSYKVFELQRNTKGIYRDSKLFSGTDFHPSSVANIGIGLISLCIADSMGWESQAEDLVITTLDHINGNRLGFTPDRNASGYFRHFIDMNTGARAWDSEYSTIDSGLLMCGALFCKKYFSQNTVIDSLVTQLWNSIDWSKSIANPANGQIYLAMQDNGNGVNGFVVSPYSEYMIVAWLAKNQEIDPNGVAHQLWNQHFENASSLPFKTYQGFDILTDNPTYFLSSFVQQFPYYHCHHFTTSPDYLQYLTQARQGDSLWFENATQHQPYEWGLGAGSFNGGFGYSVNSINDNPAQIVSPHIIAGFLPVYPQGEQDLIQLYQNNKGVYTLPTGEKILWRYSLTDTTWQANEVQGIDFSTMLFGLASLPQFLGNGFFSYYNDFDFPTYTTSTQKIDNQTITTLFPNPNNGSFTLEWANLEHGNYTAVIYNSIGQEVGLQDFTPSDQTQISFNLALSKGLYFIKIIKKGEETVLKTLKFLVN